MCVFIFQFCGIGGAPRGGGGEICPLKFVAEGNEKQKKIVGHARGNITGGLPPKHPTPGGCCPPPERRRQRYMTNPIHREGGAALPLAHNDLIFCQSTHDQEDDRDDDQEQSVFEARTARRSNISSNGISCFTNNITSQKTKIHRSSRIAFGLVLTPIS